MIRAFTNETFYELQNNDYFGQVDASGNCSNNDGDEKGGNNNCDEKGGNNNCDDVEDEFIRYQLGEKTVKQNCNSVKIISAMSLLLWCLAKESSSVI